MDESKINGKLGVIYMYIYIYTYIHIHILLALSKYHP
jgi:hypothetical protein